MCRTYLFVREFLLEVIQERYLSFRLDLPLETFDSFLDAKAEWDDGLTGLSQTTRMKLRQILFRIMREAGPKRRHNKSRTLTFGRRYRTQAMTRFLNFLLVPEMQCVCLGYQATNQIGNSRPMEQKIPFDTKY